MEVGAAATAARWHMNSKGFRELEAAVVRQVVDEAVEQLLVRPKILLARDMAGVYLVVRDLAVRHGLRESSYPSESQVVDALRRQVLARRGLGEELRQQLDDHIRSLDQRSTQGTQRRRDDRHWRSRLRTMLVRHPYRSSLGLLSAVTASMTIAVSIEVALGWGVAALLLVPAALNILDDGHGSDGLGQPDPNSRKATSDDTFVNVDTGVVDHRGTRAAASKSEGGDPAAPLAEAASDSDENLVVGEDGGDL